MNQAFILYDADCDFCCFVAALLLRLGPRLRAEAIQSAAGEKLLDDLTPEQRLESWHFVDGDGKRYSAGAAIAPAVEELRLLRHLAPLLRRSSTMVSAVYDLLARHRAFLTKLVPERAKLWAKSGLTHQPAEPQ